jgi:predicted O-linked N-acetylglucosamine transferase (SPINDLY family)
MSELAQLSEACTQEVQRLLHQGEFQQAIQTCESQISFPVVEATQIHWLYGLAFLLNGQEEEAQSTWMMAMMEGDEIQVANWVVDLANTLDNNSIFQEQQGNLLQAQLVRYHIREIAPDDYGNLLRLIRIKLLQAEFTIESFTEFQIINLLKSEASNSMFSGHEEILLEILNLYLDIPIDNKITVEFVTAIRSHVAPENFTAILYPAAVSIGHIHNIPRLAVDLLELVGPEEPEALFQMAEMLLLARSYKRAIEIGQKILDSAIDSIATVIGSNYILKAYLNDGKDRISTLKAAEAHKLYLNALIAEQPDLPYAEARYLISAVHLLSYISDHPQDHRVTQNQLVGMCEKSIQSHWQENCHRYRIRPSVDDSELVNPANRPLRIGYICSCFYDHSVGWLARSLMYHHDPERFNIFIYAMNTAERKHHVKYFYQRSTANYWDGGFETGETADRIYEDQIDILIDLDSITRDSVCTVMALKPAPIQATWMGWDAVGMSAIDYYIADNYALPEKAQDYYVEKIWRLPQAFLAVDGFEVGIPTVNRRDLDIPEDAIVFLNPQRGFKLTPEVLKLQLQILKATPNSYLLLKGIAEEALQQSLGQLAQDVNVSLDRIRPIPYAPSEEIHRANLAIADIILDTFPYNGATTTMEALWMERPIVTLVGQQFSARNSYTMMMNAGITEGISWTPEEYVAWGIRLGTEPELRQQVAWKLRQGKKSAPLWNGKAFAQQMEAAYTEMYQIYVDRSVMPQIARE